MKTPLPVLLLGLVLLAAPAASAARIEYLDSPDVRPVSSASGPVEKKFFWDDATHRFAVALTYPASGGAAAQTLRFHFPHVRREAGTGRFVLDLGNGRTAAVAHKFLFGTIHLADKNHLLVQSRHRLVRVTLEIAE